MAQITDLNAVNREDVDRVLLAVADHFTNVHPTEVLDPGALVVTIGAEAYNASGRSLNGGTGELSRAALAAAPEVTDDITRGEYALRLRRTLTTAGVEWSEDDNQRVIPSIPGPRPAPTPGPRPVIPRQPEGSDTPTCCGRPMTRDGQQWVCGKCKGWHDLGGGR
ncbi:hypothetical protein [Actinacidiphila sp. ITFR-21]|uniref:hypothetical protein n=1 Tax=Actinacidiphila sp. ITFR-21 TaxID=3075199 RepID=UPI00288AFEB8|nr:hypothetical protein [Streptomyces sp. ITFR-21]WNI20358.1 hypothetical protein RLT57_32665 [Streptomyces sp. ITFR-21]